MRFATGLFWVLLLLASSIALAVLLALGFSTRRAIEWFSADFRYEVCLLHGGAGFDWNPSRAHSPGTPTGWTVASYGKPPSLSELYWWPSAGTDRTNSRFLIVPLWIPFVVTALPATVLWYLKRRSVRRAFHWLGQRLTPRRPTRVRFWLVAAALGIHILVLFAMWPLCSGLQQFFWPEQPPAVFLNFVELSFSTLFLGSPLCAVLWAWLWTRWRNRLFRRRARKHCMSCGYDLTGNVSGTCPECGQPVPEAGAANVSR
jgi:hypothetical protein